MGPTSGVKFSFAKKPHRGPLAIGLKTGPKNPVVRLAVFKGGKQKQTEIRYEIRNNLGSIHLF
jgi:hypothetical protein